MAPWLPGLRSSLIPNESDSDKAREKVAAIFRRLIEVAISDIALGATLEQSVWPVITSDEVYTDIFVDEVIKAALSFGMNDDRVEVLGSIIVCLGTVTIRGRMLSRLRKALNRTSLRPTKTLPENTVWAEICVLLRLCLATSFDSGIQSQLYLPEIFHLVSMLANTGSTSVRTMVYRLLINTVHAMCTTFGLEESKLGTLKALLFSLSETRNDSLFNTAPHNGVLTPSSHETWVPSLAATETLAFLLAEISTVGALSVDMSNAWRSRWMSLVASTAFQSNPAIQPRAFTVMGCLAREDVDDDLLYQVLVALRSSIGRFMEENDGEMLVAIITSLTKMVDKLPSTSRYGLQLFWLALSLVRLVPLHLFNCSALFLDAVLNSISASGDITGGRMVSILLQGRVPLEDASLQLDELYGINFNIENFHFAVCASLVKGLTDSVTRGAAIRVLSTFLEVTTSSSAQEEQFPKNLSALPYLGLLISRTLTTEEAKENLWLAGWAASDKEVTAESVLEMIDIQFVKDKELLLNAAISIVDFTYLDDIVQNRGLLWLNKIALKRATVILHLWVLFCLLHIVKLTRP